MSRRTILVIVFIVVIALVGWVAYESNRAAQIQKQTGQKQSLLQTLFPFGAPSGTPQGTATGTPETGTTVSTSTPTANVTTRLAHITDKQVAGFTIIVPLPPAPVKKTAQKTQPVSTATGTPTATVSTSTPTYPQVRFMERGTGYVYDTDTKGLNLTKISGTVIARAALAAFANNGANVAVRYVKTDNVTVATYLGLYNKAAPPDTIGYLTGSFLPEGVLDLVPSSDGKGFVVLLPSGTGSGSAAFSVNADGSNRKQLMSSPFGEWLLDQTAGGTTVTTKAAASVPGFSYFIRANNVLERIIGNLNGLTTKLSPDGQSMLYGTVGSDGLKLYIEQIKNRTAVTTGLATLPEKCVWTRDSLTAYCAVTASLDKSVYPDDWYQGIARFNDGFWKIDAKTGTTTEIDDGEGNYLDATNLALDSTQKYLVFTNKNDGSLWSLDLTPAAVTQ